MQNAYFSGTLHHISYILFKVEFSIVRSRCPKAWSTYNALLKILLWTKCGLCNELLWKNMRFTPNALKVWDHVLKTCHFYRSTCSTPELPNIRSCITWDRRWTVNRCSRRMWLVEHEWRRYHRSRRIFLLNFDIFQFFVISESFVHRPFGHLYCAIENSILNKM